MSALPPNWARYVTDDGKEYFHNGVSNTTQWDRPEWPGMRTESFGEANTAEVYQYKPTESDLNTGSAGHATKMVEMQEPAGKTAGGAIAGMALQQMEAENISLTSSPGGAPSSFGAGALSGVISAATADDGGAQASGLLGTALEKAQALFDVSTDDVKKRLRLALVPYPIQAENDFRTRPDFWGPFWVATTAVFFLAATGNFARLLEKGDSSKFKADYGLVSVAAFMIYGALIAVPLIARASLYFSGQEASSINFHQMICVYGYSLAPAIPVSVLCLLPFPFIRWLLILVGLGASLVFIKGNLWADIAVEAPSLKWTVIALLVVVQASIFMVYRVHFFAGSDD
jgi:hypothetical protein